MICTQYLAKSNFFADNKEPKIKLPKLWLKQLRWAFSKSYHELKAKDTLLNVQDVNDFKKILHNSFKFLKP